MGYLFNHRFSPSISSFLLFLLTHSPTHSHWQHLKARLSSVMCPFPTAQSDRF